MILPTIFEMSLVGVFDRGVPNRERIVLRPTDKVNLHEFFLVLAVRLDNGMVMPIHNQAFWFPDIELAPPGWIVVYTGPGTSTRTTIPESGQPAHTFHWGNKQTVLNRPEVVPILFSLGGILTPPLQAGDKVLPSLPARPGP